MNHPTRREQLRAFLTELRARIAPLNVGLPSSAKRRVAGLRQSEVAELAGVSELWYRLFESGHEINVSCQFLASLASALRMDEHDKCTLYRLAIPELYEAQENERDGVAALVPPFEKPFWVGDSVKTFAAARDRFLTGADGEHVTIRTRILNSWKRSRECVDPERLDNIVVACSDELRERRDANGTLLTAAESVISTLSGRLGADRFAIILTDPEGTILDLTADRNFRRRLANVGIEPGTYMSESYLGTNGIGTAIADQRPLLIVGPEHFREPWRDLMCNGAPIRDPQDGKIIGILDATADYRLARPELMAVMLEYAYAIEERLGERQP